MCGIAGIVGFEGDGDDLRQHLAVMNNAMIHRGPDEEGMHFEPEMGAGLAVRRLSIVDPEGGSQPMYSEDGSIAVVCNGEIYNHRALRRELRQKGYRLGSRSDCEVIAHLYQEEGVDFLKRLNGMFALAILDRSKRSLLLARDPIGMKHLYWAQTGSGLAFASEARALFAAGLITPQPDWQALGNFFTIGWVPSPKTAFEGLQRLTPGSYLLLREGELDQARYWVPQFRQEQDHRSEQDYSAELAALLGKAVGTHLDADVPAGLYLSGGWDSSLIALYATRQSEAPLNSYSLVFPEDPGTDESRYSRLVAGQIGTTSHEIEIRHGDALGALNDTSIALEEPLITSSPSLAFLLAQRAGADVKFVIGGEGSDELFGGYSRYRNGALNRLRRCIPHQLLPESLPLQMRPKWRRALGFLSAGDEERAHLQLLSLSSTHAVRSLLRGDIPLKPGFGDEAVSVTTATRETFRDDLDIKLGLEEAAGRLADGILFAHDKTSMAHSLEVRMPFLDLEVVQFALRLPSKFKINRQHMKAVLAPLARELPDEVASRPKQGLHMPSRIFRTEEMRQFYVDSILETSLSTGIFRHQRLERMVRRLAARTDNRAMGLYPLCHFCLWWNNFMKSSGSP